MGFTGDGELTVGAGRAIGLMLGVAADAVAGDGKHRGSSPDQSRDLRELATVSGVAVLAGVLIDPLGKDNTALRVVGTALTTWGALGGAALATRGTALARELETEDLAAARQTLAGLDPRDTTSLDRVGLTRASVESVAENTSTLMVAPLLLGAVAGAPGLLAHRLIKSIKGRLARRPAGNRVLATAVDRCDELIDLLPTRFTAVLTVAAAPVVGGSARGAWTAWRRDASAHPSPNAGRVEAAFAGALEIRLGGRIVYPGRVQELPVLGAGRNPDAGHVTRAVELSRLVGWLGGVSSAVLAVGFGALRRRR